MRHLCLVLLVFCCLCLFPQPVWGQQFLDTLDIPGNYRLTDGNLGLFALHEGEGADGNLLMLRGASGGVYRGGVRYHATGVETLTLRIYSPLGTFSSPDLLGNMQLGDGGGADFLPPPGTVRQVRFHPGENLAYLNTGSWQVLTFDSQGRPAFSPAPEFAGKGLINFGVNLYAAREDAKPVSPLGVTRTAIGVRQYRQQLLIWEDFTCTVPSGMSYLWVELNDLPEGLGSPGMRTSLAWVQLEGKAMVLGPQITTSEPPQSSPAEEQSTTDQKTSSRESALPVSQSEAAAIKANESSAKEAVSKFEGVIASPDPSRKSTKIPSSSSERSAGYQILPEVSLAREATDRGPSAEIYQVTRQAEKPPSSAGVGVYVAVMACVVLYLLVKPKREQDK